MDESKIIEAFDEAKQEVWTDDDQYTVGYNNGLEAGKNIAIDLLKEQEAVEPEVVVLNETDRPYRCPRCYDHFLYKNQKYCDKCGQKVMWE